MKSPRRWVLALALGFLLVIPVLTNSYQQYIVNLTLVYVIVSVGLNILLGVAGQFAFAHPAFFGLGAYACAILMERVGLLFWSALPLGVLLTATIGGAVGIAALRVSGLYLAMLTTAFTELVVWVLLHSDAMTRGANGFRVPPARLGPWVLDSDHRVYWVVVVSCVPLVWIAYNLVRSRFGRALMAIREDERSAAALGIDVTWYKLLAFTMSAAYAGLAGGLYGLTTGLLDPANFGLAQGILQFAMVMIGGLGSMGGAVVGAVLLTGFPEVLRPLQAFQEITFAALLLVCVLRFPDGIYGLVARRWPAWREGARAPLPTSLGHGLIGG